jgi:DNA repair exonuclease SbcCD ATPase subunit
VRGLKSLLTRIEKVEAPDDIIVRRLEPALAAVTQVTDRLRQRLEDDEALLAQAQTHSRESSEKFSEVIANFAELQANLSRASQQSATAAETAQMAGTHLVALSEAARRALDLQKELSDLARQQGSDANDAIRDHLADLAKIFERYNDAMALELERCRRMVAGTGTALAELAESVGDRLEAPAGGGQRE